MANNNVVIPKWFISVVSLVLVCAVPWAFNISLSINTLEVKLDNSLQLQEKFEDHQKSHITSSVISDIQRRLDKLESSGQ